MSLAATLLTFLIAIARSGGDLDFRYVPDTNQLSYRVADQLTYARGYTTCYGDRAVVVIAGQAPLSTTVHELAHALDCLDDGRFNASPSTPAIRARCGWDTECFAETTTSQAASTTVYPAGAEELPLGELIEAAPVALLGGRQAKSMP